MAKSGQQALGENEITILARLLGNGGGAMPAPIAEYLLTVGFSEADRARMHDLAVRNQEDRLSPAEKEEMFGYARAGTMISILHSKARQVLGVKPKKKPTPY